MSFSLHLNAGSNAGLVVQILVSDSLPDEKDDGEEVRILKIVQ